MIFTFILKIVLTCDTLANDRRLFKQRFRNYCTK